MFARWGRFVYRRRWFVLSGSAVLLALSIGGILAGGDLAGNGNFGAQLPAGQTNKLIQRELRPNQATTNSSDMTLLFSSSTLVVSDDAFKSALEAAVAPLQSDRRVTSVSTPYNVPNPSGMISRDQHIAQVEVTMRDASPVAAQYYKELLAKVHPGPLTLVATGQVPLNDAFNSTLESDIHRAEIVVFPISLLMLVVIFAAIVAAALPLSVGVLTIVGGVGGTMFLARFTDVSQYALNIVTLIGLAVSIDYSLFVVNRFRDELAAGASREEAMVTTMATAGRAIFFSGITVAIGLSAMLFFQGTFLASMGAAGGIVVGIAIIYGLTFLPALVSILGPAVDRLRVPFLGRRGPQETGAWHAMALWVMKRPLVVLVPALGALLLAGTPFLQLRLANGDVDELPPSNQARQGWDTFLREFPGHDSTFITAVVDYPDGTPLTTDRIGAVYDLTRRLAALPNVLRVDSIFSIDPSLTRADYQRLYTGPSSQLPAQLQQAVSGSTGPHIILISVVTNKQYTSDEARALVRDVRAESVPGGQVLATGNTAFDLDIIDFIVQRIPIAVGAIVLVTYFVLFLLTGSVVLPLKAVLTNLVSISASFGALVFVFQEGHFSELFGFTPQSVDPTVPVILFSIVFGISMDYEVFLISRIQEEYRRTGDNQRGVALGLEKSGRLITGAAAIMVAVFLAFGLAQVLIIKSIGVGLALAIAIDASIVRMLIVPSVMRILGRANWWAPSPLRRLHERIGASEMMAPAQQAALS